MKKSWRWIVMIIFISGLFASMGFSQQSDYKQIFGADYQEAINFFDSNLWIADSLHMYGVDPCHGIAVVFPELIRYSALRDKIEIQALLSLYVQYGKNYSDFSIGYFQMKPSFAENLEKEYISYRGTRDQLIERIDTADNAISRKNRLERMITTFGQVRYLAMFLIVMNKRKAETSFPEETEYIRYLASAYNYGFQSDISRLQEVSKENYFYSGLIPTATKYNYSDISTDFFNKHCTQIYP
jgi:hypothetical protein